MDHSIKETFFDMNTSVFLKMYDEILSRYTDQGFLNNSKSFDFVHIILDNLDFNDAIIEYSSDDDF